MELRAEIKEQSKTNFTGQYWMCVGAFALFWVCMGAVSMFSSYTNIANSLSTSFFSVPFIGLTMTLSFISTAATFLLAPPLIVGFSSFGIRIYKNEQGDIGDMFSVGFKDYWRNVGGVLWMELFIFLWSLLFIIPGIVKAFSYFMTPYILADSKKVSPTQALVLSMRMTDGHKGEIFVMCLSFIGWWILTGLTGGILAIFYTGPYTATSFAGMYSELKQNALEKGIVTAEELE